MSTGNRQQSGLTAVILAGGKGARLRPFTMAIPKPLLPLGDTPILEIVIRQLKAAGVDRIIVTLGHMAPFFTSYFADGERLGVHIEYSFEDEPLGTAGPLRQICDLPEYFLVMNGDVLTTLDYADLLNVHTNENAFATIAAKRREVQIDFGVIEVDAASELAAYHEKPVLPYEVSMGINVLSRAALDFVPSGQRFDMPDLMRALRAAGHRVKILRSDCYWQDIGRFEDYQRASEDFSANPSRFLPAEKASAWAQP